MKARYHLVFYLRKNRNQKTEESEIYLRITMNSKRSEMSIGRRTEEKPKMVLEVFKEKVFQKVLPKDTGHVIII